MKKKFLFLLLFVFVFCSGVATAGSINGNFKGNPIIKIFSEGRELVVEDVPAINYQDRTMVPIYLLRQLGIVVEWNEKAQSVNVSLPKPPLTDEQIAAISKNVGIVKAYFSDGKWNQGSGFVVEGGYFVTNYHVAGGAKRVEITINGKTYTTNGEVSFQGKDFDIWGVKIDSTSTLKLNPEVPKEGTRVYAIGYPHGQYKVTEGVVTAAFDLYGDQIVGHSAVTTNGNSGGVIVSDSGEVIGITSEAVADTNKSIAHGIIHVIDAIKKLK